MSLNDYIKEPRRDWSNKHWLQHAYIQYWSPWNSKEEKEYWHYKIKQLQEDAHYK